MSDRIYNRLGIDIGGTSIKFLILRGEEILYRKQIKTAQTGEQIVKSIQKEYCSIIRKYPIDAVGVGTPGEIKDGCVTAENLSLQQFPLEKRLCEQLGSCVVLDNDANCAALGELYFGAAKNCRNLVMITLGTGVGGGIILNGRIFRGQGTAGEFGHMIIQADGGENCLCGLSGCWEQYASASALLRQAAIAAAGSKESKLYQNYQKNGQKMTGEDFFDALKRECPVAEKVFDQYLYYLSVGIESISNILAPDIIVLAGGITKERDLLLNGIKKALRMEVRVDVSELKNDAGAMGAAMLSTLSKEI